MTFIYHRDGKNQPFVEIKGEENGRYYGLRATKARRSEGGVISIQAITADGKVLRGADVPEEIVDKFISALRTLSTME